MSDKASNQDVNILGMKWIIATYRFSLNVVMISVNKKYTKEIILGESAKLFDPFGLILRFNSSTSPYAGILAQKVS